MKKLFLIALFFALTSCAGSSQVEEESNSTDNIQGQTGTAADCAKDSAASKVWGECNVKKTIYKRTLQIRECLQFERNTDDKKVRELLFKIHLLPTGKVSKVFVEGVDPQEKLLSRCLVKEISRLHFAAPPVGVKPVVYFPFKVNEPGSEIYR